VPKICSAEIVSLPLQSKNKTNEQTSPGSDKRFLQERWSFFFLDLFRWIGKAHSSRLEYLSFGIFYPVESSANGLVYIFVLFMPIPDRLVYSPCAVCCQSDKQQQIPIYFTENMHFYIEKNNLHV